MPAFCPSGAWVFKHTLKKKKNKIRNLVLVDELQAGLAGGDIYLSVYLKEVCFKIFSLDLFIYFVYVCVCVLRVNILTQRFQLSDQCRK